jgi:N-acetylglutamate synthase-like GNAT family acetyltransferase/DNA-binding MarR family transcriptional regulator
MENRPPPPDVLREQGGIFLGSRLKRLGEQLQASAAEVIAKAGLPVQPSHMPLLTALEGRALTIGQLVETLGISQPGITRGIGQLVDLGLVRSETGLDQRRRVISLTAAGTVILARARLYVWPRIADAVDVLCRGQTRILLDQIGDLEAALAATPLHILAGQAGSDVLTIREYTPDLAVHFRDINTEWIQAMFRLEDTDRRVLEDPQSSINDTGGIILFVEARGFGIIGTCALQKTGENSVELTKMAVREAARGLKAGEFLLAAIIDRARSMKADPLYLLTNSRCAPAIHLYEKLGFRHDADIMARYGARYARCDVAMRHVGPGANQQRQ